MFGQFAGDKGARGFVSLADTPTEKYAAATLTAVWRERPPAHVVVSTAPLIAPIRHRSNRSSAAVIVSSTFSSQNVTPTS